MLTSDDPHSAASLGQGHGQARGLSPAGRLLVFVLFAALLFAAAWQVGHDLGPIGTSHVRSVIPPRGQGGGMNMGAGNLRFVRRAEAAR
jgi:hypothetical protein